MKSFVAERLPLTNIDWPSLVPLIGQANRALALCDGILYGDAQGRQLERMHTLLVCS